MADIAQRLTRRRRRRRIATTGAGVSALAAVAATGALLVGPDTGPTTETTIETPIEDPNGIIDGPSDVTDGPTSDIHVEQVDLVFPECTGQSDPPSTTRREELTAMYLGLIEKGILDLPEPEFLNGIDATFDEGRLRIALSRRHGPTIDWFVGRVDLTDLCIDVKPPRGFHTGMPDLFTFDVDYRAPLTPEAEQIEIVGMGTCGLDIFGSTWREHSDRVEIAMLYREWPGSANSCPGAYRFTVELEEPLGERVVVQATQPDTLFPAEGSVLAGSTAVFSVDPNLQTTAMTIGDDVMLQSLTDPTRQIQVSDIFSDRPTLGLPRQLKQDRWEVPAEFAVPIPTTLPAGDYSVVFIDDPAFNGRITVTGGDTCPERATGHRLSGGTLVAEVAGSSDSRTDTACWYIGAQFSPPFSDSRVTNAIIHYVDGVYTSGETAETDPPIS